MSRRYWVSKKGVCKVFGKENLHFTLAYFGAALLDASLSTYFGSQASRCMFFCICSSAYINRICPAVNLGLTVPRGICFGFRPDPANLSVYRLIGAGRPGPCSYIGLLICRHGPDTTGRATTLRFALGLRFCIFNLPLNVNGILRPSPARLPPRPPNCTLGFLHPCRAYEVLFRLG